MRDSREESYCAVLGGAKSYFQSWAVTRVAKPVSLSPLETDRLVLLNTANSFSGIHQPHDTAPLLVIIWVNVTNTFLCIQRILSLLHQQN